MTTQRTRRIHRENRENRENGENHELDVALFVYSRVLCATSVNSV